MSEFLPWIEKYISSLAFERDDGQVIRLAEACATCLAAVRSTFESGDKKTGMPLGISDFERRPSHCDEHKKCAGSCGAYKSKMKFRPRHACPMHRGGALDHACEFCSHKNRQPHCQACDSKRDRSASVSSLRYDLLYDSVEELDWFRTLDPRLETVRCDDISKPRKLTSQYVDALAFDRPDIVLCHTGHPVLVLERTKATQQGNAAGQRFARLRASATVCPVTIYACPFTYTYDGSTRSMNVRMVLAARNVEKRTGNMIVIVNYEESLEADLKEVVSARLDVIEGIAGAGKKWRDVVAKRRSELDAFVDSRSSVFDDPPKSVVVVTRSDLKHHVGDAVSRRVRRAFQASHEFVLYKVDVSDVNQLCQGPYTGGVVMNKAYLGIDECGLDRPLIMMLPKLKRFAWDDLVKKRTESWIERRDRLGGVKVVQPPVILKNFGFAVSAMVFKDGVCLRDTFMGSAGRFIPSPQDVVS